MTTKTSIKRLLSKKKLSGEEVGRLMILDLVEAYKKRLQGEVTSEGILSESDKNTMVANIYGSKDTRIYNAYRDIHSFMINTQPFILMYSMQAELYFWRLFSFATELLNRFKFIEQREKTPKIMTKKQLTEALNAKLADKLNAADLIYHAIEYYISLYLSSKTTPFDEFFEHYQSVDIKNPRIMRSAPTPSGYFVLPGGKSELELSPDEWKKELGKVFAIKDLIALLDSTCPLRLDSEELLSKILNYIKVKKNDGFPLKWIPNLDELCLPAFNILKDLNFYYKDSSLGKKDAAIEFMRDFPDLYSALVLHLAKSPELAEFKGINLEEFDKPIISVRTLYEKNVLSENGTQDIFYPTSTSGFAILEESSVLDPEIISRKGHYVAPFSNELEQSASLQGFDDQAIDNLRFMLMESIAECLARERALDLVGDFVSVPDVKIFYKNDEGIRAKVEALNFLFSYLYSASSRIIRKDRREFNALKHCTPVMLDVLEPTKNAIDDARASLSYETFQGGTDQFIYSLKRVLR